VVGVAIGAAPGIALLHTSVTGILLAIVGAIVGAVVGGSAKETDANRAPIVGAIVGAIPGLVTNFVKTRLAFSIILVGALGGWFIGTRIEHKPPGVSTT
jgi:hypothetical protein